MLASILRSNKMRPSTQLLTQSARMCAFDANQRAEAMAQMEASGWRDGKNDDDQRDCIRKEFIFPNFSQAYEFMSRAGVVAEANDHHPEWTNDNTSVDVTLATHTVDGFSEKDVYLGTQMERLFKETFNPEDSTSFMQEDLDHSLQHNFEKTIEPKGWKLEERTLSKDFEFENFMKAWAFMTHISELSELVGAHPTWFNVYNRVEVKLGNGAARSSHVYIAEAMEEYVKLAAEKAESE